jgi:hypothetical protein
MCCGVPLNSLLPEGGAFIIADFDDGPSVAYQDTAARGQILEDPDDIASLVVAWDTIRGEALPRSASLALMEEILTGRGWSLAGRIGRRSPRR